MNKSPVALISIIILIVIVVVGWVLHSVISLTTITSTAMRLDSTRVVSNLPANYLQLFRNNILTFDETILNNTRKPISKFRYREKFLITVYEIDTLTTLLLDKVVSESHLDQHISYYTSYTNLDQQSQYEIRYKSGEQDKLSKIYLNVFGDSFQTVTKNDSLAYYYFRFKNFSIRYQNEGKQDFFGTVENPASAIPMELMFYKKNKAIYFLLMVPFDGSTRLEPGTLGKLISPVNQKSMD